MTGFMTKTRLLTLAAVAFSLNIHANDWIQWRGPNENGYVDLNDMPEALNESTELWRIEAGARSAPLIYKNRVFIINRAGDGETMQERIMAIDLDSGKIAWEHRFNVFLTDIVGHRLGWANLAIDSETGNIFGHGVQGLFFCINYDGKVLWQRSLTEEFGRISGYGGRTNSPVVDGQLIIINFLSSGWGPHGRPVHRFVAMNKRSGEVIWWSEPSGKPLDTTYSVPVVAEIDGTRLLIAGLADGAVHAMKVNTGEPVWQFKLSKRGINSSVIVDGYKVYVCHGEENLDETEMGRVVCIDGRGKGDITKTGEIWRFHGAEIGYTSPLLAKGALYVFDNSANIYKLDPETGKEHWNYNYGNIGRGSGVWADDKIYIGDVGGTWNILQPSETGCKTISSVSFKQPSGSPNEIYASAAATNGRVIMATNSEIMCYGKKVKMEPSKHTVYKMKKSSGKATHLQIIPAETWVKPGEMINYQVRAFDAKGNMVDAPEAKWSMAGLKGSFKGRMFTAGGDAMQAGMIKVEAGDLKAQARLRIIPPLNISFDFENNKKTFPPPGWITSKLKSQVVDFEGGSVLKKLADRPAPPFARMRNYMTPPLEVGYTVQSDMNGVSKKKRFMPDMGLLNSRYKMILLGTSELKRTLRLVTWDPMPRLQTDVDFDWKADTWYTMKMSVDIVDGKGLVRGKVWKRGEKEPDAWSIEMTDPVPNTGGSPGLYAYSVSITSKSAGTPVYFDNVSVTKNK